MEHAALSIFGGCVVVGAIVDPRRVVDGAIAAINPSTRLLPEPLVLGHRAACHTDPRKAADLLHLERPSVVETWHEFDTGEKLHTMRLAA